MTLPQKQKQPVEVPTGEPSKMSFEQYMAALGKGSSDRLVQQTGMARDMLMHIDQEKPIPLSTAKLICRWLSKQFERDIQLENVTGLHIVNPGKEPAVTVGEEKAGLV